MECWVSKYDKKGAWSSFLKKFEENIQKWRFWFRHFWRRSNFEVFFRPSTLKTEIFSTIYIGSICAYRVFYLPIFRRIEGWKGVKSTPFLVLTWSWECKLHIHKEPWKTNVKQKNKYYLKLKDNNTCWC